MTTGGVLWARGIKWLAAKPEHVGCQNGVVLYVVDGRTWYGVDMKTGNVLWISDKADYPWGHFWAYGQADAYAMLYGLSYGGVYAFNVTNGKIVWHYANVDNTTETPYASWPFGSADPIVADGKIYSRNWSTVQHSTTKDGKLYTLDAYDGTLLWTIDGYYSVNAIAEGELMATNSLDGYAYAFGKGPTLRSLSLTAYHSPGNLHLDNRQRHGFVSSPTKHSSRIRREHDRVDAILAYATRISLSNTGVPVSLYAMASNGNVIDIGTTTSNANGYFSQSGPRQVKTITQSLPRSLDPNHTTAHGT